MRVILLRTTVCRGMFWTSAGQAKWGGKSRMSKKVTQQGKNKRVSAKESWEPKVTPNLARASYITRGCSQHGSMLGVDFVVMNEVSSILMCYPSCAGQ
jgi:hypothetical protein